MSSLMYRLGHLTALHPWRTIAAWIAVAIAAAAIATASGGEPHDNWDIPGAQAQAGLDSLREHEPASGGATAQAVLHDRDGAALTEQSTAALAAELATVPHVAAVSPPRLSEDGATALFELQYDVPVTHPEVMAAIEPLEDAAEAADLGDLQVAFGGEVPGSAMEMDGRGEIIGIGVALVLLVLTFGSLIAAGLPIVVALTGLFIGSAGVTVLAAVSDVSTSAPTVATMVGLGVGIDYALLLVTRHLEYLRQGHRPVDAAARANATAGRSVIFAGATVLVALMGLRLADLPTYSSFGFATGISVAFVMAASVTLVPALLRLSGHRLVRRRERRAAGVVQRAKEPFTARWAARVGKRPAAWATVSLVVMLALAAPALSMRTWPNDASTDPSSSTTRQAYDLISEAYGPGANGSLTFVADRSQVSDAEVAAIESTLASYPGIESVSPATTSPDGAIAVFTAEPGFGPSDERTSQLIADIRAEVLPADGVDVTGSTALFYDISELLADRIWIVIGFVVIVSVILLAMMFRSIVVPIKAALMNLLSIGAAYGVMTLVFQHGWGVHLLGLDHAVPVSSWVPILMFAVLFGLSMDYEVFLLSRIREEWLRTGDARGSVVRGLASTGRVISAAAAIMVAVFLGFATESNVVVKMTGVGMAVAIALDATIVRMVLVPATMSMLGRWNWWLPASIDRYLPHVDAEVEFDDQPALTPSETPVSVSA